MMTEGLETWNGKLLQYDWRQQLLHKEEDQKKMPLVICRHLIVAMWVNAFVLCFHFTIKKVQRWFIKRHRDDTVRTYLNRKHSQSVESAIQLAAENVTKQYPTRKRCRCPTEQEGSFAEKKREIVRKPNGL